MGARSEMITVERCSCGQCHNYWLVGVGHFVQGSGFTKEEAENIAHLLNKQAEEKKADAP